MCRGQYWFSMFSTMTGLSKVIMEYSLSWWSEVGASPPAPTVMATPLTPGNSTRSSRSPGLRSSWPRMYTSSSDLSANVRCKLSAAHMSCKSWPMNVLLLYLYCTYVVAEHCRFHGWLACHRALHLACTGTTHGGQAGVARQHPWG